MIMDNLLAKAKPKVEQKKQPEVQIREKEAEMEEPKTSIITQPKPASKPKIEVLSISNNYESMIVSKQSVEGTLELVIELDTVESMQDINLDINPKTVRISSAVSR